MVKIKEQLVKRVVRSGNGGAVWVPRNWLGEEILISRLEKPKLNVDEEIVRILLPYLKNIIGIYMYGSYARGEETSESDIDILVVGEGFSVENKGKFDFKVISSDKLKEGIRKDPFLYSIVKEARVILNSNLLLDLRKVKFLGGFKWFKSSTLDSIKSDKEFLNLDKLDGEYVRSFSVVYSLILRLRGVFLLKRLEKGFSNKLFKKWVKYISNNELNSIVSIRFIEPLEMVERLMLRLR